MPSWVGAGGQLAAISAGRNVAASIHGTMSPVLAVILVLVLVAAVIAGYEYYIHRGAAPPSTPVIDPASVVWKLV